MTEPGAGSDLRGIKTTAKKVDGGYLVNGRRRSSPRARPPTWSFVKTGEATGRMPSAC
jgi:long-chain-acyl-CoA dehydrogenase